MDGSQGGALGRFLDRPPIVEALASVEFRPRGYDIVALVHESDSWSDRFPIRSQQPALPPTPPPGQPFLDLGMQFGTGVLPSRIWSASSDQQWLVQSQDDRLTLNWRRIPDGPQYPGFELLGELFSGLVSRLQSALIPVVAEFTYVNDIPADFGRLHATYSLFHERKDDVPGKTVGMRLQETRQTETGEGPGFVTTTIEPINGDGSLSLTRLTISAKVFAPELSTSTSPETLVTAAHDSAKSMFYAVVSDEATDQWGEAK